MGIKYQVNSSFFKKWTPAMAYVLGYIFADGSLENAPYIRARYLRITSKEKEILNKIKSALDSEHNLQVTNPQFIRHRGNKWYLSSRRYLLRIGDHEMYKDLVGLGLIPRKSLIVKFPHVPEEFFAHFVRGYFDGDGSVFIEKSGLLKVVFSCGSLEFLQSLSKKLHEAFGVKVHTIFRSNGSYQLSYRTKEALELLAHIYRATDGLLLERKYRIYKSYIRKGRPRARVVRERSAKALYAGANPAVASIN